MTTYTTTDVLICGAGVTGLTLAIELARHGVSFRLIEKRATPFTGSRGKGIQPRTQEIFEDIGILNKVVAAGGLYPRLRTYRHDGSYVDSDIAHNTKPTHAEPYHLPLMVPQNAASLRGAGEELLDSYEQERRPVAESLLHLSTRLLDSQKQGGIKRERDVQQLDIQYTDSPLAHTLPERQHGLQAGERAPDAPLLGAGGQSLRLFQLLQGPDWNLLAYETHGKVIDARRGLRIHHIGEQDELIDTLGHFRESYHLAPGQCVVIRPDGYVGAFFHGKQSNDIENYLSRFAIGIKDEY
ncbi:FAD-dependent monooxygenase [Salmonella enterica subsp. enterica serovar Newport]